MGIYRDVDDAAGRESVGFGNSAEQETAPTFVG